MAFSDKELKIIEWGKANGKSQEEISEAIFRTRTGLPPASSEQQAQPQQKEGGFMSDTVDAIKDIPQDLKQGFDSSVEHVSEGMETANEAREQVTRGEITPLAGTVKTLGGGAKAGARTIGEGFMALIKSPFSQKAEDKFAAKTAEVVADAAEDFSGLGTEFMDSLRTSDSELDQKTAVQIENWIERYKTDPNLQAYTEGAGGVAEAVAELWGLGKAKQITQQTMRTSSQITDNFARQAYDASNNVLENFKKNLPKPDLKKPTFLDDPVNNIRYNLSDVDENVRTVLNRSNADEVDAYFRATEAHNADVALKDAMEIAGEHGETASDLIWKSITLKSEAKKAILMRAGDTPVSGNTINEVMRSGIESLGDKYGISINARGEISQAFGRFAKVDNADAKLIGEYFARMNSLGVAPSAREVDDFVDWAQSQLYKQKKSVSTLDSADSGVVKALQQVTGDLNTRLKNEVGGGYGEINEEIAFMLNVNDELSRALGADGRKGGGLMKRIFSPSGGQTRQIFNDVRDLTGVDLFKEATLAKFAMESAGDSSQRSLLQSLDILAQESSGIDLTKPMSIIKYIRERGDMDGEELAKEIIKRNESEKAKNAPSVAPKPNIERDTSLKGEDALIQEKSIAKYEADPEALTEQYIKDNGKIVNTDEARKLFKEEGYNGANSAAVHEASSAVAKDAWRKGLTNPEPNAIIYAGGSGTGKTSVARDLVSDKLDNAAVVLDGNLSGMKSAQLRIEEALAAGKTPSIVYVYREPKDAWVNGVISRMLNNPAEGGRVVPMSVFLGNHKGSHAVVKELTEKYPDIDFGLIDNSLGKNNAEMMTLDKFNGIEYADIESELLQATKQLYDNGKITKQQYEALIQ
jgi:hypothetical protein